MTAGSDSIGFSVIVPAHNSAAFVTEAVDSVLAQTHASFEIIVVDDGSTDDTRTVLARYADDPRVRTRFLEHAHGGPSRARNIGLALARGEVIVVLDADDLLAPQALEWHHEAFRRAPEAGLAFFNSEMVDFQTGAKLGRCLDGYDSFWRLGRRSVGADVYVVHDSRLYGQMIETNFIKTSGTGLPRRVLDVVGPFDESLTNADDWDMWLRIARRYPYAFVDRAGVQYRRRQGSVTDRGPRLVRNRVKVLDRQLVEGVDRSVHRSTFRQLAQNHAMLGFAERLALNVPAARRSYLRSLSYGWSWMAIKGWCVTWLGTGVLSRRRVGKGKPPCSVGE